jgi:type IV secretion system protein VirB5
MKISKTIIISITLMIFTASEAIAQGIPVYDASNFAQVVTQLDQMTKDYQKQLEQLNEAIKQTGAITGTRDMGSIANSAYEAELRRYLPSSWQQTMNMINASDLSSGALGTQNIYSDLYTTYNPISGAQSMPSDPNGAISKALDRRAGTTYAAMAASEQAYNNISNRISTYETLLDQLNNTTDLKASVDLQARISAENGMILNELMRLNAIQMQQKSSEDNELLTNYHRASAANKYDAAQAAASFRQEDQ